VTGTAAGKRVSRILCNSRIGAADIGFGSVSFRGYPC
jgi:hypothetical protein